MIGDRIAGSKHPESLVFWAGLRILTNRLVFAGGIVLDSLRKYRDYSLWFQVLGWGDPVPGRTR